MLNIKHKTPFTLALVALVSMLALHHKRRPWQQFRPSLKTQSSTVEASFDLDNSRLPSSDTMNARDSFQSEYLEKEIKDLEKEYFGHTSPSFSGKLKSKKNIVLDNLSPMALSFLERHDYWLDDQADFSNCQDVPCFYNALYGASTSKISAGDLFYWFYLMTGYKVAIKAEIPDLMTTWDRNDYKNFLFSADEQQAIWRMTKLMPSQLKRLATLQTVHRGPRVLPSAGLKESDGSELNPRQAARAGAGNGQYYVYFLNLCLNFEEEEKSDIPEFYKTDGYIYRCMLHELSHHYDYTRGGYMERKNDFPSESEGWKSLSGWDKQKVLKSDGSYASKWVHSDGAQFVSWYAKTSPEEDWAESLAMYRIRPAFMKESAPLKFDYMKNNVFNQRSFDSEGQKENYQNILQTHLSSYTNAVITKCATHAQGDLKSDASSESEKTQVCIEKVLEALYQKKVVEIEALEYEAFDFFNNPKKSQELSQLVLAPLQAKAKYTFLNDPETKALAIKSTKLRQMIANELGAAQLAMYCSNLVHQAKKNEASCYQQLATEMIALMAQKIEGPDSSDLIKVESAHFLATTPYEKGLELATKLADSTVIAVKVQSDEAMDKLFSSCKNSPLDFGPDKKDILLRPYTGLEQYIRGEIIHCLNFQLTKTLEQVLQVEAQINHKKIKNYELNFYIDRLLFFAIQKLNKLVQDEVIREALDLQVKERLLQDWITNLVTKLGLNVDLKNESQQKCLLTTKEQINLQDLPVGIYFNFHPPLVYLTSFIQKACLDLASSASSSSVNPPTSTFSTQVLEEIQKVDNEIENQLKNSKGQVMLRCLALQEADRVPCYTDYWSSLYDQQASELKDKFYPVYQSQKEKFIKNLDPLEALDLALKLSRLQTVEDKQELAKLANSMLDSCLKIKNKSPEIPTNSSFYPQLLAHWDKKNGRHNYLSGCLVKALSTKNATVEKEGLLAIEIEQAVALYKEATKALARNKKWAKVTEDLNSMAYETFTLHSCMKNFNPKKRYLLRNCLNASWNGIKPQLDSLVMESWWADWYVEKDLKNYFNSSRYRLTDQFSKKAR